MEGIVDDWIPITICLSVSSYLQDKTNGRLVVKSVKNQELAYKLVWIACKKK